MKENHFNVKIFASDQINLSFLLENSCYNYFCWTTWFHSINKDINILDQLESKEYQQLLLIDQCRGAESQEDLGARQGKNLVQHGLCMGTESWEQLGARYNLLGRLWWIYNESRGIPHKLVMFMTFSKRWPNPVKKKFPLSLKSSQFRTSACLWWYFMTIRDCHMRNIVITFISWIWWYCLTFYVSS
jgi:hypothetical protein